MKVLDLFCGAGGLSKGFELAGHKIILGIDNWQLACENFKLNHPNAEILCKDIATIKITELPEDIDIIVAGSPCQEFTSLNLKKQPWRGMINICHFFRIVEKYKPTYFLLENVLGLQKYLPRYLPRFSLKASDFNCKTARRRVFVTNIKPPRYEWDLINKRPERTVVSINNITSELCATEIGKSYS